MLPSFLTGLLSSGAAGGPAGLGIGIGMNLLGSLIATSGEKHRRKQMAEKMREAMRIAESRYQTAQAGLSTTEEATIRATRDLTATNLGQRGVLDSSFGAAEVQGQIAPHLVAAAERRDRMAERLAAGQMQIAEAESSPGYASAIGGALGDTGGILTMIGGHKIGRQFGKANQGVNDQEGRILQGDERAFA